MRRPGPDELREHDEDCDGTYDLSWQCLCARRDVNAWEDEMERLVDRERDRD